ncbi:MAG: gliding motility-associated C-terminal domain-containing protein [Flavobacteriaceae bacterium]|nr:gliding motility-associated C-terminal domain-containing protein [Flavobacteriaceae bacterium]
MKTYYFKTSLKTLLLALLFSFAGVESVQAQLDLRTCGYGCTSNNYNIADVYLSSTDIPGTPLTNTSCTPGDPQLVYMIMTLESNQNTNVYHARFFADLQVGSNSLVINEYLGTLPKASQGPIPKLIYGPFTWTCGEELTLLNPMAVWKTTPNNAPDPVNYDCHDYSQSQCQFTTDLIVSTPLAVQFEYTACTSGSEAVVYFESTTNGGTQPYSYAWNFDGGTLLGGTASSPIVSYDLNGGPYNPSLKVTDINGNTNLIHYTLLLDFPDELTMNTDSNDAECASNTGSGSFTPIGGTPPYSFNIDSNTTGASTMLNGPPSTVLSFTGAGAGVIQVTVTDDVGCVVTESITIEIQDSEDPIITAPDDYTVEGCDSGAITDLPYSSTEATISLAELQAAQAGNGNASDDGTIASITYSDVINGSCPIVVTRTFTVTDSCGKTASDTQLINIDDTTSPTIDVEASDLTVECDGSGNTTDLNNWLNSNGGATASDSCSSVTWSNDFTALSDGCQNTGEALVTFTATDECGNSSTSTATFTIEDTTPPTILTPPADLTVECDGSGNTVELNDWLDTAGGASADEICGTVKWENNFTDLSDECGATGSATVEFSAVDACGNVEKISATFTIVDTTAPTFTAPADLTIECDQDPSDLTLTGDVTDEADNCSTGLEATYADSVAAGACANESVITRTWTLVDDCGNTTTADQTITVEDTTAPVISTVAADQTVQCDGFGNTDELQLWLDTQAGAVASDNCGDVTWTNDFTGLSNGCGETGQALVTFTASDACGNSTSTTALFSIIDLLPPTIDTEATDLTVECDGSGNLTDLNNWLDNNGGADSSDICGTITWTNDFTGLSDDCGATGSAVVIFTATDDCGNTTTTTATFTIQDTTAPTFTTPADLTIECDQDPADLALTGDVTDEADNCSTGLEATYADSVAAGACANESVITRTWTLVDDCGNTTTADQTINVVDTTAPVIDVEAGDITVECDGDGNGGEIQDWLDAHGGASASDNCGDVTWTHDYDGANSDCADPIPVTFTATDACGNSTSTTASYAIQDTTAPSIDTEAADATVECDGQGNGTDLQDWLNNNGGAVASDDCSAINWSNDYTGLSDDCGATGSATVTFTATDSCGNSSSTTATFTIEDTTAPTFTAPADLTIECDQDPADLALTGDVTDEADNCSTGLEATYADSVAAGACANESVITRTWTLVDDCGNTTTADQTITVVDTTPPTFTAPADVTIECDQDENDLALTGDVTDEADNCSAELDATFEDAVSEGECANESIITRTWTLVDDCGNTTTATQTITVVDTTAPTFTVPADITIECDQDPSDLELTGDVTDEADNCSTDLDATFEDAVSEGECANESIITRTWTLVDDCGNTTTADQTINVVDTTAPTFTVPADVTVECDDDATDLNLTGDVTDEADNCSTDLEATYDDSMVDGECPSEIIISRTWTLVDDCGNTTTAVQTITSVDTTAPVFSDMPEDAEAECDNIPAPAEVSATDNCGEATVTFTEEEEAGSCIGESFLTRTWTAVDACGNESIHIQIINVIDTTPPVLVGELEAELDVICDAIPEAPELVFEDACSSEITVDFIETSTNDGSSSNYVITRDWIATDDCGNSVTYTQTLNVSAANIINGSDALLCAEDMFVINLFDFISGDYDLNGEWVVTQGDINLIGSEIESIPFDDVEDQYIFTYVIDDENCPSRTDVVINIDPECENLCVDADNVYISKAVTANGDQWNECFEIKIVDADGEENFLRECEFVVEVQIFNRWGAKIYENMNYDSDSNCWNGTAHSNSIGSSDKVPTGTYYYIVNLRNSGLKPFAGPIYVGTN